MYSASYLHVLAVVVFPLSLCTQPPCFRGGRSAGDATSFRRVCVEEDSGTFSFFVHSSGVSSICWNSCLYLLTFCSSYLRILATVVFPLSLCTQPPFSVVVGLEEMLPLFILFAWRRTAVPLASSFVLVG